MSGGSWAGKKLEIISFTRQGSRLAEDIRQVLGGRHTAAWEEADFSLAAWSAEVFATAEGLLFVGATGIAVRAIAPHVRSKATDPAVVAVDEGGCFAIPLLSGHLGGANDLARVLARLCGAVPVITTATDVHGVFAVDAWARRQGCVLRGTEKIKEVSSWLLSGGEIRIGSPWPIGGEAPKGVFLSEEGPWEVLLTLGREAGLCLIPPLAVLGVGCRKGASVETLEAAFAALLKKTGLCQEAFCAVATIELKAEEPGLLDFCARHGWPLTVFTAEELQQAEGSFTPSDFVQTVTGVDNVCERSAALASGGALLQKKLAGEGVTMAVAVKPFFPDWSWRDE